MDRIFRGSERLAVARPYIVQWRFDSWPNQVVEGILEVYAFSEENAKDAIGFFVKQQFPSLREYRDSAFKATKVQAKDD